MPASSAPTSTEMRSDEGGELHRASVDHRLQEVVLELLVDDNEHHDDDALPAAECKNATQRDDDAGDGRACQRNQVENRNKQAERHGIGNAHHEQHDRHRGSRDHADQNVSA